MKRLTVKAVLVALAIVAGVTPANAETPKTKIEYAGSLVLPAFSDSTVFNRILDYDMAQWLEEEQARQEEKQRRLEIARNNSIKMEKVLKKLKSTAGKTWYVFSGTTPRGWDCSGLVYWTYQQMGIELYHGATAQANSGDIVKDPLPGDLVVYYYSGSKRAFHIGVYLGDGKVIHSQKPGTRTRIESATDGVINQPGVRVTYVRLLPMVDLPYGAGENPHIPDIAN